MVIIKLGLKQKENPTAFRRGMNWAFINNAVGQGLIHPV